MMIPALTRTLMMVAEVAGEASDDWWIIGSAAVMLHGGEVPHVKDVDLLMSGRDADAFLRRVGVEPQRGEGNDLFRSEVFGTWTGSPVAVEAFGRFKVCNDGMWREVRLSTREPVMIGGERIYVPSKEELVQMLRQFGRAKDLQRARALERSL